MNDIVERIDAATGRSYVDRKQRHHLLLEAADEIERLRALITEWADADAGPTLQGDLAAAEDALRKAVGR